MEPSNSDFTKQPFKFVPQSDDKKKNTCGRSSEYTNRGRCWAGNKANDEVLKGREIENKQARRREHPDLSTEMDYVLFTFHCLDAQSGQVFY